MEHDLYRGTALIKVTDGFPLCLYTESSSSDDQLLDDDQASNQGDADNEASVAMGDDSAVVHQPTGERNVTSLKVSHHQS